MSKSISKNININKNDNDNIKTGGFIVLDFGSQLTQLIARRLRELNVYSELMPYSVDIEKLRAMKPSGIILSGGPSSVYEEGSPQRKDLQQLLEIAPILGICYGMQLIAHELGGRVVSSSQREYGFRELNWSSDFSPRLEHFRKSGHRVWMSHGDVVDQAPPGFEVVARSDAKVAALKSERAWAVQFHPEVSHTEGGLDILKAFVFDLCQAKSDWDPPHITSHLKALAARQVADDEAVICGLSGGVDSSVVALLLTQTLGRERVFCIFVDNGLLRKDESETVMQSYENLGLQVRLVDASDRFLTELASLPQPEDPEAKRKCIGRVFIDVFQEAVHEIEEKSKKYKIKWLAQGTLYPDVIESVSPLGASVTIKSHHNVGGLPEKMNLKLIEPLRELFKDEVRAIGREIGLPSHILNRHPFPGPGLAIRVIGKINRADLEILKNADAIFIDELKKQGLYDKIWQAFCVLLPVHTVGVMGDGRTYERVLALRAVTSSDGMTADWYPFEFTFLRHVSNRITNEVKGVNRVVYDVTSKPPGTIEWE